MIMDESWRKWSWLLVTTFHLLAECPACYGREIKKNINIFLCIFLAPKTYYRPIIGLVTVLLSRLFSELWKPSSPWLKPGKNFRGRGLCSCNTLTKTNNYGFGTGLPSCLLSERQKTFSPGLKPRTVFWGCGLHFCNLFFKTNNFGLRVILLLCLVSKLQESLSPGLKLRTTLLKFWPFQNLFLVSRNKHATFGTNSSQNPTLRIFVTEGGNDLEWQNRAWVHQSQGVRHHAEGCMALRWLQQCHKWSLWSTGQQPIICMPSTHMGLCWWWLLIPQFLWD
jgi:hypothetical protein